MITQLHTWYQLGLLRAIDWQFAKVLDELNADPLVVLAAALTSAELSHGHVCMTWPPQHQPLWFSLPPALRQAALDSLPPLSEWTEGLCASPLVCCSETDGARPLRYWQGYVYLYRYHEYEVQVADQLLRLAQKKTYPPIAQWLAGYFPSTGEYNAQAVAAATATSRALTVISGGPGTGKTTTVAKLLSLLLMQPTTLDRPLRIKLAAPTGKAAARLTESIGLAIQQLALPSHIEELLPKQGTTLHRLLGALPDSNRFRHHHDNPLVLDILVIDEASMIDLPMMAQVLMALPEDAKLILLGDKDQLASVEAGAVLGDICSVLDQSELSQEQAAWLSEQTGYAISGGNTAIALRDCVCFLDKSWRFSADSGIGQLAQLCHRGDRSALAAWLNTQRYPDVAVISWEAEGGYLAAIAEAVKHYAVYLADLSLAPQVLLGLFNQSRVLCAIRQGDYGVEGLNAAIEQALAQRGLLQRDSDSEWYDGRPILITANNHGLGLYNGDVGLCLYREGQWRIWFETAQGQVRSVLPTRLPAHMTVYAMTIHKSQGSEFDHTLLLLPPQPHPVVTRELVYTGITRAKKNLTLYSTLPVLLAAVGQRTVRYSGLRTRLLD